MENIYFDENGYFLGDFTVEKFFKEKIDFSELFESLLDIQCTLNSDLFKCYSAYNLRKSYKARVSIYYKV